LYPATENLLQFIVQRKRKGEQQTTEKGNFLTVKLQHHCTDPTEEFYNKRLKHFNIVLQGD